MPLSPTAKPSPKTPMKGKTTSGMQAVTLMGSASVSQ